VTDYQLSWLKKVRLQKAFERVYVVNWSDGFRDGVPDSLASTCC